MQKKEVLVIFKTHLDVGFTGYSADIVKRYLEEYIPGAIRVGYELLGSDTPFIWTVGSWMIRQALEADRDGKVAQAIRDGILNWHALPFTTHTELMNPALFRRGLAISAELDERFGRKTIAAKMTDVPGHTIGMVPLMRAAGVELFHIGVNSATPVPPVPPIFKWKLGEDAVTVIYSGGYGAPADFGDFVLYFAHTNDNCGPQSAEEIREIYRTIADEYPGCTLRAATLNDVAEKLRGREDLPVVTGEIGDTWIHGAATDPGKLSRFRAAQRHLAAGGGDGVDLTDSLLVVPEHTWGMDVKTFFPNFTDYYPADLAKLASQRSPIEASWREQRNYVARGEKALGLTPDCPEKPDLASWTPAPVEEAGVTLSWQIFDNRDYARYLEVYVQHRENWAIKDFTKVGLPDYEGGTYEPAVTGFWKKGSQKLWRLEFDPEIAALHGLPRVFVEQEGGKVKVQWFGKLPSRIPQACWLKFHGLSEGWELDKMGTWVKPEEILGSPLITAVDRGVRNEGFAIESLDAALVAPFGRHLLEYNLGKLPQDLYFNLYNNIWNTNFPMWYGDDALFRFAVEERKEEV